ncbi:MAG: urease accessory protein UreF [Alphaproteobacteria bacterium]|nr:urease accessory protein UreF [Alphaproteobacteria bacterium]
MSAVPDHVLFLWLSPAFPIGSFAYSHGLEWAVASEAIVTDEDLFDWIATLIQHGSGRNDLLLLSASFRALQQGDQRLVQEINQLALALSPSRERHLETVSQGNAFIKAIQDAWPHEHLPLWLTKGDDLAYPVAVAIAASVHGLGLKSVLDHFIMAYVANLISAATRLSVIGQTQGQKLLSALMPMMQTEVNAALASTLDDLGGFALCSDIASMQHETQYSRMFRS